MSRRSSTSSRYFIFHLKVAATVGKGIVDPAIIDHYVVFGALVGAISLERHHVVLRLAVVARRTR